METLSAKTRTRKPRRILSINGGGTRGLIPSLMLVRLEQLTGKHPTELFDLIIGTSTGAMIAAVLTIRNNNVAEVDKSHIVSDIPSENQDQPKKSDNSVLSIKSDDTTGEVLGTEQEMSSPKTDEKAGKLQESTEMENNEPQKDEKELTDAKTDELNKVSKDEKSDEKEERKTDLKPKTRNTPWKYVSQDLLDVYIKEGPAVFGSTMWRRWSTLGGIYGGIFDTKIRDERFNSWIGGARLKDLLVDTIFTSIDKCTDEPTFFKSRKAREDESYDCDLADVVKCCTAAPLVWPLHQMKYKGKESLYGDALYGKNPAIYGMAELKRFYNVDTSDMIMLSLGTGYTKTTKDVKNIIRSGISYLGDAFSSTINASTKPTLFVAETFLGDNFMSLDVPLTDDHMGITDVDPKHLSTMLKTTLDYLDENEEKIKQFAQKLLDSDE